MKPVQKALALGVAGLCGGAYALPQQVPYYTSKFPQHPQNLGYAGDYPKYWQGESYTPGKNQEPTYYDRAPPSFAEPEPTPPRPNFTGTKYPAKEAIKYYSGESFPIKSVAEPGDYASQAEPENASSNNIKITNDTPFGAIDNDKSYTRITKSPSLGGAEPASVAADPQKVLNNDNTKGEDTSGDPWSSFSFGVVSDTLNYRDPYQGREGQYERKTDAMSKIEKMMGKEYSAKEVAEASGTTKPAPSRLRRRGEPAYNKNKKKKKPHPTFDRKPMTYAQFTAIDDSDEPPYLINGQPPADWEYKYTEPEYDAAYLRNFGYDIRGYDLPTLKLIDEYECHARDAGLFRPYMYNPYIPDLTMDIDGNWKTPAARAVSDEKEDSLSKRDWPEHIQAKAEKMMNSAKDMQEKGQLVIDNDPAYQNSLREKEKKELAAAQAAADAEAEAAAEQEGDPFNLLPPTGKNKSAAGSNRKAYPGGMTDDMSPPPQNIQPGSKTAKVTKQPASQGQPRQPVQPAHKQPNGNAPSQSRKNANKAPQNQQQPQRKNQPMGNFPQQGGAKGGFKKNPMMKRDVTFAAGHKSPINKATIHSPEYPPGTTITRKTKCNDAGKCITVAEPVAAPVGEAKTVTGQIYDGQPQLRPGVAPRPVAPRPVAAPAPVVASANAIFQIGDGQIQASPRVVAAPAPSPEVRIIKTAQAPPPAPVVVERPVAQPRVEVSYIPVVKQGEVLCPETVTKEVEVITEVTKAVPKLQKIQVEKEVQVEKQVPVVKKVVKKPCGCESSSCSCDSTPSTCPCGDPSCGKDITGPEGCTCGAPGCNCNGGGNGGPRSFSSSHSNGIKDASCKDGPGCNASGAGNGGSHGHGHGHSRTDKIPATPSELEAFWRKQVPEAFKND
ncbi:hypothetical protein L873DRAFT_1793897 [Choiromyces venosus 120613-1]|uniref:Uncharacterized protein n=1 Tax=Choiromyces venosus 120613-1 TaxID=1336337 RepID=A0A3N4J451_9PEZI|nr:hypothetical protein L873DRAFT_1793897 [Choiromyces venosus 120613-1]